MTLRLPLLLAALLVPAAVLTLVAYSAHVPLSGLSAALRDPDPAVFGEIYLHYALVPRLAVAALAGAALALAGVVFQQVLKNPLAEPATLGLLSGAQLGIMAATLLVPALAIWQREVAGLAGGFAALALVGMLASRHGFSPVTLLLCGMIVSFFAGSASVVLALFQHEYLRSVFIWASGSLVQNDFSDATALSVRLAVCVPLLALLLRPLTVAGLDDASARSLGLSIRTIRLVALSLACCLSALVVVRVGVIAFVGLAAPHLATLAGVRSFAGRFVSAPIIGAALLLLADSIVLALSGVIAEVPTGTATAMAGAVLLLVLLRRMPASARASGSQTLPPAMPAASRQRLVLLLALTGLAALTLFSLTSQLHPGGLSAGELIEGRWPRVLAAASAGAMLALAGGLIQAMTGNPLASPEGLGVSSGAGLGITGALLLTGSFSPLLLLGGGAGGAVLAFLFVLAITRKSGHAPGPVLLAGVAIGTFAAALISFILASGDPRAVFVLAWSMGPTYRAAGLTALAALGILLVVLLVLPLMGRWLEILPLGDTTARALGLSPRRSRTVLLAFSALLTAAATLITGPLSFIGLIAPHIAASVAPGRALLRIVCAAAIGAALMVSADWLGRTLDFPYEIPAGILASFIGGPYFLWLLYRKPA